MNILIEGWRGINHSFSLVNQWQIIELLKTSNIYFKDVPFISDRWNTKDNSSGIENNTENLINKIPEADSSQDIDITYRISCPFDFNENFKSKLLFVFGTCEYKFLYQNNLLSKEEIQNVKKKYEIKDENIVLSNIGAMSENKGIEVLVSAYGILKKKYKNLKLILKDQSNLYGITTNHIFENIKKSEFNKKFNIINYEMKKDIIIISKNLSIKELKEIYSITNCYVSPYLAEGFNLTPLEAVACGTQIVVTKGGSTDDYFHNCMGYQIESEEIKREDNSYILKPKIDSLIAILDQKIINKEDNYQIDRSNFVNKNFSWRVVVNKLKKEFDNKLNSKSNN
jgi:glycosyltransferase involved in cell wall biosynthesis